MDASLSVPTATSVRQIPAKVLIDNRIVVNSHLKRTRGGKVSFTHLIGYAVIQALKELPGQNVFYDEVDGKPASVVPPHVNFGLAIDVPKARWHQSSPGSQHQACPKAQLRRVCLRL